MTTLSGILELPPGSEGRIRQFNDGLVETQTDPFVPQELSERYPLRQGQRLTVQVVDRKPKRRRGRKPRGPRPVVETVVEIEGLPPDQYAQRKRFEDLTPLDPQPRMTLEYPGCPPAAIVRARPCPVY